MLLPFKKGAFHFAIQAGVPIVPVVVANYERLFSFKKRRFEGGKVQIRGEPRGSWRKWLTAVLDPIPTTDLSISDVDKLACETREKMLDVLQKISPTTNSRIANGIDGLKKQL